jgi:peptidoglycan hydrolase-like protein with peptidoglycan-binding domain
MTGGRVTENAPSGIHVGTLSAHDPDAGDRLIYGLTEDGGGRFTIDPDSGALSVAESAHLDFETVAHHRLVARVTDSGGLSHETQVTVSVGDMNQAPRVRRQSFDLEETALAGTYVGTVRARDPDGDVNGVLSYAIHEGNSGEYFTIDPDSGALSVAQGARLDPEAGPSFKLAVTVTDGGGLAGNADVIVSLKEVELTTWRDEERVALIQEQLNRAGLDPGPIDGKMGPRTRAAIETYRQRHDGNMTQPSDREAAYYLEARGHFMFAFNYEKLGNYDDAIREYSQTIKLRPAFRNVYLNRGLIYHKMGLYDRAIADYNMAIELDPDNERAFYNRARSYYQAGFYSRAMMDYLNTAISWL